jgi:hypothetical protein
LVQASRCTDPRDKVYGLLGLRSKTKGALPHLTKGKLDVNYNKSVQHVYQDAAEFIILTQQDLEICYAQPLKSKTIQGLPSWVPDWSVRDEGACTAFLTTAYTVRHLRDSNITFEGRSMYIDGLILDDLEFTTSTMSCENPLPDIKKIILHLCNSSNAAITSSGNPALAFLDLLPRLENTTYKNGQPILEALWRTLRGDTANFEPARPVFVRHFYAVLDMIMLRERGIIIERQNINSSIELDPEGFQLLQNDEGAQKLWQSILEGDIASFFKELVNTIHGRVFFTTSRGYMGFGATGAKLGDQVCVLGGGQTLFILRKHGTHFEMLGDAYLHGMMQGEGLDLGKQKVTRFRIC